MSSWKNPLPGVPLIESPFFDEWLAQAGFDATMRGIAQQIRRDGYAVFDYPVESFDRLAADIRRDIDGMTRGNVRADARTGHKPIVYPMERGFRVQDAWAQSQAARDVACNPRVLEMLAALYGRRAWPFQTLNFTVGTQQPYHSDMVHFSSIPERFMCGVWVALEDIDARNGPLFYYPGSHAWPNYSNEQIGDWADEAGTRTQEAHRQVWDRMVALHRAEPLQFHARKGQGLIWAANLLHGGSKQLDPGRSRLSQVTHYYFDDCAYYTPMFSDQVYGRTFFREPFDISTGRRMRNSYLGHEIPADAIDRQRARRPLEECLARFDSEAYLKANPDVRSAGIDARQHFIQYGYQEGRPLAPRY